MSKMDEAKQYRSRPKPTDSEQLPAWMESLGFTFWQEGEEDGVPVGCWVNESLEEPISPEAAELFYEDKLERDQQRLSAALEIVEAEYQKLRTIGRVMDDGYTHLFIDCDYRPNIKKALTAALGPDNSKTKE
jgi:hypothetical protein